MHSLLRCITWILLVVAILLWLLTLIGWLVTEPGFEPLNVFIGAVVTSLMTLLSKLGTSTTSRGRQEAEPPEPETDSEIQRLRTPASSQASATVEKNQTESDQQMPYRVLLGRRHRVLRKQFLKINSRAMADFYSYEKVAQLEAYERGLDEFPAASLELLRSYFFVRREYLETGSEAIFERFSVLDTDLIDQLLDEGFRPYFLCCPKEPNWERNWLYTYPLLHKSHDVYPRTVVADVVGSFASSHGGKGIILHIVDAMIRKGMYWSDAGIVRVDMETWKKLARSRFFYNNDMFLGWADIQCEDIFMQWYEAELAG